MVSVKTHFGWAADAMQNFRYVMLVSCACLFTYSEISVNIFTEHLHNK